ncbi:NAD-dependent epimerase/dehydratase family protein [Amycolatopsis azurea]|uniref:NAD-dependent epimerase/dehydratase family protein n=1 Tax=Amycolatopsis azurea TaxID=36819 RepID=UPI0037FCAD39
MHTSGSTVVSTDSRGAVADEVHTEDVIASGSDWRPIDKKVARVALDRFVLDAASREVRSVVLCNSLIYGHGRGMSRDSLQVPVLARQARESGVARYVGEGRNIWSTVHIDDLTDLYLRALTHAPAGSFHFVENGEASFRDIAAAIARKFGLGPAEAWDTDDAVAHWGEELTLYVLASNNQPRPRLRRPRLPSRARFRLGLDPGRPRLARPVAGADHGIRTGHAASAAGRET